MLLNLLKNNFHYRQQGLMTHCPFLKLCKNLHPKDRVNCNTLLCSKACFLYTSGIYRAKHENSKKNDDVTHTYIEGIAKSHVATALKDLEDSLLRRYFKRYTRYQIRLIYSVLGILVIGGVTLYVFREPIKNNLSDEVADVASRSLGDESVVTKANAMSKLVLRDIVSDPSSQIIVSNFIMTILKTQVVREAVIQLLKDVINNDDIQDELNTLVQHTLRKVLQHEETRLLLLHSIKLLLSDQQTKQACQRLLKDLGNDDYSKDVLAQFFKDVLSSDTVKNQAVILSKDITQSVVNDEGIQKQTGAAMWNAGVYSVTPKWFSSK